MRPTLESITIIATPFILTALLVVIGYNILIASTPEARITPPAQQATTEILETSDFDKSSPATPLSDNLTFAISSVPDNSIALTELIDKAKRQSADGIYLSLPIMVNPDHSLIVTQAASSSEENVLRWVKKTVSTAHQNDLYVHFAITLNASTTISDFPLFATNLNNLATQWARAANEYAVTFFSPGITVGHPLYSNLTDAQVTQLMATIQSDLRKIYSGRIGFGYCCTLESQVRTPGYTFITAINTPEFPLADMLTQLNAYQQAYSTTYLFDYDRQAGLVRTIVQ